MKKGKAVTIDLNLGKEMKSPRFASAFQKELNRNRLAEQIAAFREKQGWTQADLARDRKSTRLNSSHIQKSRMPSSA